MTKTSLISLILPLSMAGGTSQAAVNIADSDSQQISAKVLLQAATFTQSNSWFGKQLDNIGHNKKSWSEIFVEPAVFGNFKLSEHNQLFYEFSYLYTQTFGDDASGYTVGLDNPGHGELEQVYLGWKADDLLPMDNASLSISVGQQDYRISNGFLLGSGGSAGFKNGAYWIGMRAAFDNSIVMKIESENLNLQVFDLRNRPQFGSPRDLYGINTDWKFNSYKLGLSYIRAYQDSNQALDGADIFDLRLSADKLEALPGWSYSLDYVWQDNGDKLDANAGYAQLDYQFDDYSWQPKLSYRYAFFEGDDVLSAVNEKYQPIGYSFTDWGQWFQGEIMGNYVLGNSNLNSHMLRLQAKPGEALGLNLLYFRFDQDQPAAGSKHFADEIDLILDYSYDESLSFSGVVALADPGPGATRLTTGDEDWLLGMLYLSYRF